MATPVVRLLAEDGGVVAQALQGVGQRLGQLLALELLEAEHVRAVAGRSGPSRRSWRTLIELTFQVISRIGRMVA
ncbi:MAG: hypothetical protein KatS3mg103_0375 [Phycisphaerales bacterium]|nr:MAG: hypothetical protein KatS3mg103_0375 [Phycisphaerales bacterium]